MQGAEQWVFCFTVGRVYDDICAVTERHQSLIPGKERCRTDFYRCDQPNRGAAAAWKLMTTITMMIDSAGQYL